MSLTLEDIRRDNNIKYVDPVDNVEMKTDTELFVLWISSIHKGKSCSEKGVKKVFYQIYKEELESAIALRDQYKKELSDLGQRVGIAEVMNPYDIDVAINRLQAAIVDKEKSIAYYTNLLKEVEV